MVDKDNQPNVTIMFTMVSVTVSFAWLGVETPDKWKIGVGLYIAGREFSVLCLCTMVPD